MSDTDSSFNAAETFCHELATGYLCKSRDENPVIVPIGVYICLWMLKRGLGGSTKKEIESALGIKNPVTKNVAKQIINALNESSGTEFTLKTANGLFVHENFRLFPNFVLHLLNNFGASVKSVQFGSKDGEKIVNDWVAEKTNGAIQNILERKSIDDKVALVNAIYMKAKWVQPFDKELTTIGAFVTPSRYVKIPMMRQTGKFLYLEGNKCALAFFPYQNLNLENSWELGVVKTDPSVNPTTMLGYLRADALEKLRSRCEMRNLDVKLPKCKIETSVDLGAVLKDVFGIREVFDPDQADFSGMRYYSLFFLTQLIFKNSSGN